MASSISSKPEDRQSLSTFRTMGSTLAGVIVGAGIPLFAYDKVGASTVLNGPRFTLIAGIFSILAILCYMICFTLTTERVYESSAPRKQPSVGVMLKNAFSNRALISIIVGSVVMLLAQLTLQSMSNYIYPNYYGNVSDLKEIRTFCDREEKLLLVDGAHGGEIELAFVIPFHELIVSADRGRARRETEHAVGAHHDLSGKQFRRLVAHFFIRLCTDYFHLFLPSFRRNSVIFII